VPRFLPILGSSVPPRLASPFTTCWVDIETPNQITLRASAQANLNPIIRDAVDTLCAQGIGIAAAGVRVLGTASIGRVILCSATDKARAVKILAAHNVDAT
jgi:hypothetical protein